jgi:hypothetical protein
MVYIATSPINSREILVQKVIKHIHSHESKT